MCTGKTKWLQPIPFLSPAQAQQVIPKTIPIVHVYGEVAGEVGISEASMAFKHDELAGTISTRLHS